MIMSLEKARAMIAEAAGRSYESIPETAAVGNFPAWDSLAHMRLVLALEERLERQLSSEEVIGIQAAEDVAKLLRRG
jgi:acyl carrier protein